MIGTSQAGATKLRRRIRQLSPGRMLRRCTDMVKQLNVGAFAFHTMKYKRTGSKESVIEKTNLLSAFVLQ